MRSLDLQPRTQELYLEAVTRFQAFAGAAPEGWSRAKAEDWLHELRAQGRKPQTVNVYRKGLRYATRAWAAREDKDSLDFARNLSRLKVEAPAERVPLTYDEAGKLLKAASGKELEDKRDYALILLALRTGLRRGGLVALDAESLKRPHITTRKKGGGTIKLEADEETLQTLEAWLRVANIKKGAVFRREDDKRMTAFDVWAVFRRRAKQAGIRHVFPHLARHTTVTWLREEGVSPAVVSRLTGQTERTIENIYTHARTHGAVSNAIPSLKDKK